MSNNDDDSIANVEMLLDCASVIQYRLQSRMGVSRDSANIMHLY